MAEAEQAAAPLREAALLLRAQWCAFAAEPRLVLRWMLTAEERDWALTFLRGRMDGVTKALLLEAPFADPRAYGFVAGLPLLGAMAAERIPGASRWSSSPPPPGTRDVDAIADDLASFARHCAGPDLHHVAVAVVPESVADAGAFAHWVESFADALLRREGSVRLVVLDDVARPLHDALARRMAPVVSTVEAGLTLPERIEAAALASADLGQVGGELRVMTVRAMLAVRAGRVADAEGLADAIDAMARGAGIFAAAIPARLSVGSALVGVGRHADAVRSFRAAEDLADAAMTAGDPGALRLFVMARFGVAGALLAAPAGLARAASYYEETAPHCARLPDARLELEAERLASLAYERAGNARAAWEAGLRALARVPALTPEERASAMLTPLADALIALANGLDRGRFRRPLEAKLHELGIASTTRPSHLP